MASLTVYDREGKEVGTYDIDPSEISEKINKQLLHDVVVMYQANLRQGSHRTKTRGDVTASQSSKFWSIFFVSLLPLWSLSARSRNVCAPVESAFCFALCAHRTDECGNELSIGAYFVVLLHF